MGELIKRHVLLSNHVVLEEQGNGELCFEPERDISGLPVSVTRNGKGFINVPPVCKMKGLDLKFI